MTVEKRIQRPGRTYIFRSMVCALAAKNISAQTLRYINPHLPVADLQKVNTSQADIWGLLTLVPFGTRTRGGS